MISFTTVGIALIIAAIALLLSIFIDRSLSVKNIGGLFTEAVLGVMMLFGSLN